MLVKDHIIGQEQTMRVGKPSPDDQGSPWPAPELEAVMRAWGRTQAAVGTEAARFFGDLEITAAQMRVLGQLRHHGRMSGRELAGRLGVTPGTIVPLLDRLEEQGYLRRVPDHTDRRLTWLELTPAGEHFFRRIWLAAGEKVMEAIAQFTPEDRRTFERLLNQIADHLERRAREQPGPS
jgi:DNA-binding MarR family transcriptional regulator